MKNFTFAIALLFSMQTMASLTEQQQNYAMFCGNLGDLKELAKDTGAVLTKKDILELSESRAPILSVLKTGKNGIKEILEQGSREDTGPFGAIIVCGTITQLKSEILAEGCYDLKNKKTIKDNGGIEACEELMAKLPK